MFVYECPEVDTVVLFDKIAAKAVAGVSVLTIKWLSCQGHPHAANQQKKYVHKGTLVKGLIISFRYNTKIS